MDIINLPDQNTRFFSWLLSHNGLFCSRECQFLNKEISLEMRTKYGHQCIVPALIQNHTFSYKMPNPIHSHIFSYKRSSFCQFCILSHTFWFSYFIRTI